MLYLVHMSVSIPRDMPADQVATLKEVEKNYSQELQRDGRWAELWRVVGEYANYSIFDVESNDALHEILSSLPLFPYMDITVTPLAHHPSRI
jgi:muconolactone D-isomerase